MTQKKLVSVIIPVDNSDKFLKECLDSVLEQTYPSIEINEEMECFIWGVVTYIIHETTAS